MIKKQRALKFILELMLTMAVLYWVENLLLLFGLPHTGLQWWVPCLVIAAGIKMAIQNQFFDLFPSLTKVKK